MKTKTNPGLNNKTENKKLSTILESKSYSENQKNQLNDDTLINPSINYNDNILRNMDLSISSIHRNIEIKQDSKNLNYLGKEKGLLKNKKDEKLGKIMFNEDLSNFYEDNLNENNYNEISNEMKLNNDILEINEKLKNKKSSILFIDNELNFNRNIDQKECQKLRDLLEDLNKDISDLKKIKENLHQKFVSDLKRIQERDQKIFLLKKENEKLKKNLETLNSSKTSYDKMKVFSFKDYSNSSTGEAFKNTLANNLQIQKINSTKNIQSENHLSIEGKNNVHLLEETSHNRTQIKNFDNFNKTENLMLKKENPENLQHFWDKDLLETSSIIFLEPNKLKSNIINNKLTNFQNFALDNEKNLNKEESENSQKQNYPNINFKLQNNQNFNDIDTSKKYETKYNDLNFVGENNNFRMFEFEDQNGNQNLVHNNYDSKKNDQNSDFSNSTIKNKTVIKLEKNRNQIPSYIINQIESKELTQNKMKNLIIPLNNVKNENSRFTQENPNNLFDFENKVAYISDNFNYQFKNQLNQNTNKINLTTNYNIQEPNRFSFSNNHSVSSKQNHLMALHENSDNHHLKEKNSNFVGKNKIMENESPILAEKKTSIGLNYKIVSHNKSNMNNIEDILLSTLTNENNKSKHYRKSNNVFNIFEKNEDEIFKEKEIKKSVPVHIKKSYLVGQTIFSKNSKKPFVFADNNPDFNVKSSNFVFEQPLLKKVTSKRNLKNF